MDLGEAFAIAVQMLISFDPLVTSAVAVLAQVEQLLEPGAGAEAGLGEGSEPLSPEDRKKRVSDGLGGARQLIDTLGVLEEKTKGNLTDEETELLRTAVSELRIRYVSLASRSVPESPAEGKSG